MQWKNRQTTALSGLSSTSEKAAATMTNIPELLIVTNKAFSLKAQCWVHDDQQNLLFDAHKAGVFSKTTVLVDTRSDSKTSITDQRWKPDAPWLIEGELGQFQIKRNVRSITRNYWIEGGVFDGATVQADSPDYGYRIAHADQTIAVGYEKRLSLKSEQKLELKVTTSNALLLSAVVAIVVSREKQEQRSGMNQN